MGVVGVLSGESLRELVEIESAISVLIVAGHEELNFFVSGEDTDGGEALSDVVGRHEPSEVGVEDPEGVLEVEISLKGEVSLVGLDFALKVNGVAESVNKAVFIGNVEDGLHRRASMVVGISVIVRPVKRIIGVVAVSDGAASDGAAFTDGGGASDGGGVSGGGGEGSTASALGVGSSRRGRVLQRGGVTGRRKEASAESLGGGGSRAFSFDGHAVSGGRALRSDEVGELGVGQTGITVGVDSADNGEEVSLGSVVAAGSEEGSKVEGVDSSVVVPVNGSVGRKRGVVVSGLEVSLEDIESSGEVKFLLDDVAEGVLDVVGQRVVASASESGAIKGHVPEEVVLTRKEHLEETKRAEISMD